MYALATDSLLFYKISPDPAGVNLRIWSNQPVQASHTYSYIINWRVKTMGQARDLLINHLAMNGSSLACDHNDLPMKGKVRLLGHATWNQES
jgi:hypothetical protein